MFIYVTILINLFAEFLEFTSGDIDEKSKNKLINVVNETKSRLESEDLTGQTSFRGHDFETFVAHYNKYPGLKFRDNQKALTRLILTILQYEHLKHRMFTTIDSWRKNEHIGNFFIGSLFKKTFSARHYQFGEQILDESFC